MCNDSIHFIKDHQHDARKCIRFFLHEVTGHTVIWNSFLLSLSSFVIFIVIKFCNRFQT